MISLRGTIPDLTDHAIECMMTGFTPTTGELAAYQIWADGMDRERPPMSAAEKRNEIAIISDSVVCTIESAKAARIYAHARAHNAVKG